MVYHGQQYGYNNGQYNGQSNHSHYPNDGVAGPAPGPQYPDMYQQQGPYNEYNNGNMPPQQYGQQPGYYDYDQPPQQHHGQMYNNGMGPAGNGNHMHAPSDPRGPIGPPQHGQPTKILRNPYPEVSKELKQKAAEAYDPSFPTGPVAPPPPVISSRPPAAMQGSGSNGMQSSSYSSGGPSQPHHYQENGMNNYGNTQHYNGNNAPYPQAGRPSQGNYQQVAGPPQGHYQQSYQQASYGNQAPSQPPPQQQQPQPSKLHVMTGIVTKVTPGAFGMVSEEIFYQESVVSGSLPVAGDKVVVEAEEVTGMPFKYNAKKVTRLDADLVNEDKSSGTQQQPGYSQHSMPAPHSVPSQQAYQHYEQPQHSPFETPNFGPLPSLPDSLNLPMPVPPPNLATVLPTSGGQPLKSILKRKGVNPPPPPVLSKTSGKKDANPYNAAAPSSLKPGVISLDLDRNVPGVLPSRRSPITYPEYAFMNKERPPRVAPPEVVNSPQITRLLPGSPIAEYKRRSPSIEEVHYPRPRSRSRDRTSSRRRHSRSNSPHRRSRRSRSISPRHRRGRSRSITPPRRRSRSITPTRRRSRSPSPGRRRRNSRSPSPRSRRRSISPRSRRRSTSRERRSSRRRSRSRSRSKSPHRAKLSPNPPPRARSPGLQVLDETITNGIVIKRVSSDLFPKLNRNNNSDKPIEIVRRDGASGSKTFAKIAPPGPQPVPVRFTITNPKADQGQLVPNPSFKAANMIRPTFLQNTAYNITKTVDNSEKKKKPKEQEPAYKVIEPSKQQKQPAPKLSGSDGKGQAFKSKPSDATSTSDNLLKNPANIQHLNESIQKEIKNLTEVRSKLQDTNKLLETPDEIQKLKQTLQKELQTLKAAKEACSTGSKGQRSAKEVDLKTIKEMDESVEQRLKALRSKFEIQLKEAKASAPKPGPSGKASEQRVILVDDYLKDKPKEDKPQAGKLGKKQKGGPNRPESPPPIEVPPYDEQMERLQEEIHRQRFQDEENRLKMAKDTAGLQQLYYMEDRRQRRLEEKHLARIRAMEISLKQSKNFPELTKLRQQYGPAKQRLAQEQELRRVRLEEEMRENQLQGQAEAIRSQEEEYERWLEEEAIARRRQMVDIDRANRGCEGRVLRRRTPSPNSLRGRPTQHGPPPDMRRSRRRSRSLSFERYQEDWHRRHPRDRSPPINYEEFCMRYPLLPPAQFMEPDFYPPNHPDYYSGPDGPPGPPHRPPFDPEYERHFIADAIDEYDRREDELLHREMEIQQRMEMANRRGGGRDDREDFRRFVVPRR